MKKLLLLGLAVSVGMSAYAQLRVAPGLHVHPMHNPSGKTAKAELAGDRSFTKPVREIQPFIPVMRSSLVVDEAQIGSTWYDNQSNRGSAKRITNNLDGTLSAVWTFSPAGPVGSWPDRGTGYNYYDGTNWGTPPSARIDTIRTGFTNIDWNPTVGEYTCGHTGAHGLYINHRPTKGTGPWSVDSVGTYNKYASQADVWARFALGGASDNSVHVIVNSQGTGTSPVLDLNGPLTYSRSLDGGNTWDIDHELIAGEDTTTSTGVGAEEYHIDARGDVIAVVVGGFTHDVVLYKSMDNGSSWTRTVIKAFPIPKYDPATMITDVDGDGVADLIESNAGDVTVTLDNNNMAHVAYGIMHVIDDSIPTAESFFPDDDGLIYWNESMGAGTGGMLVAQAQDFNGNDTIDLPATFNPTPTGWPDNPFGVYNTGFTCQPSIGIDATNRIFIAYSTIDERADTGAFHQALRHVFVIGSDNGGASFGPPIAAMADPTGNGLFQECVWPSMATVVDNNINIVYQRDAAPGTSLSNDPLVAANNSNAPSDIIWARVPVSDIVFQGINEIHKSSGDLISALYPNPAKTFTTVELNLIKTTDVKVEITNMTGQTVFSEKYNALNAGQQKIKLNVSHLNRGVYFCNVSTDTEKVTRKLTVE